jgi:uncharacterized protein YcbK (DUF882 family)
VNRDPLALSLTPQAGTRAGSCSATQGAEMQLTPHFSLTEFACHDGCQVPEDLIPRTLLLAQQLEVLRLEVGRPILIVSGYRSPAWNAKVEGAAKSQHMEGRAADIAVTGMAPAEVATLVERLIREGRMQEGGLGLYAGWVHYDVRGYRARWHG